MAYNDEFGYHEVIDRTHLLIESIDIFLIQHPLVQVNENYLALAEDAQRLLCELYQKVSSDSFDKFDSEEMRKSL